MRRFVRALQMCVLVESVHGVGLSLYKRAERTSLMPIRHMPLIHLHAQHIVVYGRSKQRNILHAAVG